MRIRRAEAERGGQKPPEGWIYLARSPKYTKTTFTEGYLNKRMNRTNTIAMNQHYVEKIMENPRTSYWNRMAVAEYVISHPERFMPLSDRTDDPELNEYARKKNGNARRDFLEEFRRRYVLRRRPNTFLIETSYRARRSAACRGGARPVHIEEIHIMEGSSDAEPMLCEIVWMMDYDFKAAMVMLRNAWERTGQETYEEAEGPDEEDDDLDGFPLSILDDDRYAIVEYYERPDGSSAEVYYADEDKRTISDIRFWMRVDPDERERVVSSYREAHPDQDVDPSFAFDLYKSYLYHKALGRHRRGRPRASFSLLRRFRGRATNPFRSSPSPVARIDPLVSHIRHTAWGRSGIFTNAFARLSGNASSAIPPRP